VTIEVIEAATLREEALLGVTEMPLSRHERLIAGVLEILRQQTLADR